MGALERFVSANRRLSAKVERRLPARFSRHLHTVYKYQVAELLNRRRAQVLVDIGAGKDCPFLPFVTDHGEHLIIGVDSSAEELFANRQLPVKIVANACAAALPLRDASVDAIVSRSVLEHLPDNASFFANCARVLRPGGRVVHTFPCNLAPFALINRILPNSVARRLLGWFHPEWQEACGFPAFYDRCRFSQIRDSLTRSGFRNLEFQFRYYQSIYFDFLFPLYLVMLTYDLIVWRLGIKNLACAILVTAER